MSKLQIKTRYGITPNSLLRDREMSLKAKGLFAYIQSKPDGWDFSAERIAKDHNNGLDSVRTGLKELEDKGYLQRIKFQDDKGQWEWEYVLSDNPSVENPLVDSPLVENHPNISKKDIVRKNSNKEREREAKASKIIQEEIDQYFGFPIPEGYVNDSFVDESGDTVGVLKDSYGRALKKSDVNKLKKDYETSLKTRAVVEKRKETMNPEAEELMKILKEEQGIDRLDGSENYKHANSLKTAFYKHLVHDKGIDTTEADNNLSEHFRGFLGRVRTKSDFHWNNMTSMGYLNRNFNKITRELK